MTRASRIAVVTGGTLGIGRHIASRLAGTGWAVALCSRHGEQARHLAAALQAQHGVTAFGAAADVRSPEALRQFADEVVERLGVPTAAIANAAVPGPVGPLHAVDLAAWADAVAVDLVGVANTFAVFGALMVGAGRGRMLTLSGGGVGGPQMLRRMTAYTCSKMAIAALIEGVADELRPFGVAVNAVAPGAIATRFMEPALSAGPAVFGEQQYAQVVGQRVTPDSLDDLDHLLQLLLDPDGPFITGRMLSARWDNPDALREELLAPDSSLYRLRRIDGALFVPAAEGG